MSDLERMAILDFVIGVLKEHERTLDSAVSRLEKNLKELRQTKRHSKFVLFSCTSWEDFREVSKRAEAISFKIEQQVTIRALKGSYMYEYKQASARYTYEYRQTPSVVDSQSKKDALPTDSEELRNWLARQLLVPKKKIIQGELSFFP